VTGTRVPVPTPASDVRRAILATAERDVTVDAHNSIAGLVRLYGRLLEAEQAKSAGLAALLADRDREILALRQAGDRKDQAGYSSTLRKGQEPVEAEPDSGRG
jgi:hypothetical protein